MVKALIVFATKTGETTLIGDFIAEGLSIAGVEVDIEDANNIDHKKDLKEYDAFVFGSATYFGQMLQEMKDFLFRVNKADLKGKVGGAFGAFEWCEDVPELIYNTMKNVFKMDMVEEPLRLKTSRNSAGMRMARDYGRSVAGKLGM